LGTIVDSFVQGHPNESATPHWKSGHLDIRHQQGRHEEALDLIGRAIAHLPDKAVYRNNYGAVLLVLGRRAEALAEFQRAGGV
jgi:Tfp pilus assembly protein PilF